jgi:hypothetical protein
MRFSRGSLLEDRAARPPMLKITPICWFPAVFSLSFNKESRNLNGLILIPVSRAHAREGTAHR